MIFQHVAGRFRLTLLRFESAIPVWLISAMRRKQMTRPKDDISARIEKHRQLQIKYEECPCNVLPPDRWAPEAKRKSDKIGRALDAVTWSFVDQLPQTVAGVAALLQYVDAYMASGRAWPDNRGYYDDGPDTTWLQAVVRAVGSTLQEAATAA
jgi:hypothetical protein